MFKGEELLSENINNHVYEKRINSDKAFIAVLSDLHIGVSDCDEIKDTIDFILSIPNMYVVIGSDIIENVIRNSKGDIYSCNLNPTEQVHKAVELLKPLVDADRVLAVEAGGNHELRTWEASFISIPQMICSLLGIPQLLKGAMTIGYINVNKVTYMFGTMHKHKKNMDYYDYMNMDVLVGQHTHSLECSERIVFEHNKFAKKTSVKTVYKLDNGSAMVSPNYSKLLGLRSQPTGAYITELSGKERYIRIWRDIDLYKAIKDGYKI